MRCAYCGGEVLEGDRFCMYCGKPVEKEKPKEKPKCAVCGFELIEGYKFCMNCGTPVLPNGEQPKMRPKEKPKCAVCGFELIEGYKFCMNCGTPVQAKRQEPPLVEIQIEEQEPKPAAEEENAPKPIAEPAEKPAEEAVPEPAAESVPVPAEPEPALSDASDAFEPAEEPEAEEAVPDPEEELARELAAALARAEEMKAETAAAPEPEAAAEEEPPAWDAAAEEEPAWDAAAEEEPDPAGEERVVSDPVTVRHVFPEDGAQQIPGKKYLILSNLDQPQFVYRVPIQTEVTIGRMQTDITIADDPELSRTHCRMILKDQVLYLVDAGSKNGTYLLGRRLESGREVVLRSGDLLRIGQHAYAVELITI